MDPILGLVGSIGGGLINNLFAGSRQSQAQDFAREQAATAEATFRTNRQTAYQDTMMDMKAAGLNPILAYQRGATGSTMGVTPSPSQAPVSDIGAGQGVNSALAIRRQNQELQNMEAQKQQTQAMTGLTAQQTKTEQAETTKRANESIMSTWALDKAWNEYKQAESKNNWIASNPGAFNALVQAGYAVELGTNVAKPVIGTIKDAIPFVSGSAKQTVPGTNFGPGNPVGGWSTPQGNYWPSGRPMGQPHSAAPSAQGGWFTDKWNAMRRSHFED